MGTNEHKKEYYVFSRDILVEWVDYPKHPQLSAAAISFSLS
jgi:hypothetical protein